MKNIFLSLLALCYLMVGLAQPAQVEYKIFGKVFYTDKTSVDAWEVKIQSKSGLDETVKTDKNGQYVLVTKVTKDVETAFDVSVIDPCARAPITLRTVYTGRSQSSGTLDFIICKTNTGGSACPVKFSQLVNPDGSVTFTAEPDYPGAEYVWDFGDGLSAVGKTVNHTYGRNGTYEVKLTVKMPNCSSTANAKVIINSNSNPPPPNYSLTNSCCGKVNVKSIVSNSTSGYSFKFTAYGDFKILDAMWDFGDGKSGTGIEIDHRYDTTGTYKVKVRIIGENCIVELTMNVVVTDRKVNGPCSFDFTWTGDQNGKVVFASRFGVKYDKLIWDFGDGQTSTDENPSHQYTKNGEYKVTLTAVINGVPCSVTKVIKVSNFNNPCPNDFDVKLDSLKASFSFASTTTSKVDSAMWHFGDGNTSKDINAMHMYSKAGTYTVTLVVFINGVPCKIAKSIKVGGTRVTQVEIVITDINPNPASTDITITASSNGNYDVVLVIADINGASLIKQNITLGSGQNRIPMQLANLNAGTYYVFIYYNGAPVAKSKFQKI